MAATNRKQAPAGPKGPSTRPQANLMLSRVAHSLYCSR